MSVKGLLKQIFSLKYDEVFRDYEEYHKYLWVDYPLPKKAKEFEKLIEPNSSLLDIGCGDGSISRYLQQKLNLKLSGMDLVKNKKINFSFLKKDIDSPRFKIKEEYDYILISDVIEHLKFPQSILLEAAKKARKGLIVSIPNSTWFPYRLQMFFGYFPRQSFTHLHFWGLKDFKIFCKQLGIRIVKNLPVPANKKLLNFLLKLFPNLFPHTLIFVLKKD